jgi:hypothetical protein
VAAEQSGRKPRPQAELKPAAFAFWRLAHGRIISRRRRPEQEILGGGVMTVRASVRKQRQNPE